jgi:hypothetical protein
MVFSLRRFIIVQYAFALSAGLAACASNGGRDPSVDATVRQYERWLSSVQPTGYSAVGAPRPGSQLIFATDMRADSKSGLSVVQLGSAPGRQFYVYENQTDRLISPAFSDGLAAVVLPVGRWAYIDETGRFKFAPEFRHANPFDRGVATALFGSKWVLLRKDGSMKQLDPSIAAVREFSAGFAAFTTVDGKHGYIDRTGAIVIPPSFDFAQPFCSDGTAVVRTGSGWGLVDRRGKFIVPPDYDDLHCFSEDLAAAKRGKWGFIDLSGKFVITPRFAAVGDFSEGLASFAHGTWPIRYGFIDRTGTVAVQAQYVSVYPFKFGIARVGTQKVDWIVYPLSYVVPASPYYTFWTYIDKTGKVVASRRSS